MATYARKMMGFFLGEEQGHRTPLFTHVKTILMQAGMSDADADLDARTMLHSLFSERRKTIAQEYFVELCSRDDDKSTDYQRACKERYMDNPGGHYIPIAQKIVEWFRGVGGKMEFDQQKAAIVAKTSVEVPSTEGTNQWGGKYKRKNRRKSSRRRKLSKRRKSSRKRKSTKRKFSRKKRTKRKCR